MYDFDISGTKRTVRNRGVRMERLDCIMQRMHMNIEYCGYVFSSRDYSRTFHVLIQ